MDLMTDETSSYFKEAINLVFILKRIIENKKIKRGSEVFLFTNNEVVEQMYFRELYHSPLLHQMIVEIRKLGMNGDLILLFVWISGKLMIAQGTNGLSRDDLSSGVIDIQNFLKYLLLKETAFKT